MRLVGGVCDGEQTDVRALAVERPVVKDGLMFVAVYLPHRNGAEDYYLFDRYEPRHIRCGERVCSTCDDIEVHMQTVAERMADEFPAPQENP